MQNTLELVMILLATAVAVVVICRWLSLPAMLGYLLVGISIGPFGLGWLPDNQQTRYLAEFGVVFLMFSIGLEFSLQKLLAMRRLVFGLGSAQVLGTMLLGLVLIWLFDVRWQTSLVLSGALAMSSTAIVVKLLTERLELNAPHAHPVIGVLLFQDLAVVPLLILIPALAQDPKALPYALGLAGLKTTVALVLILYIGQRLMRPWFHVVAKQRSAELFMLNVLLVTLGLGYLTEHLGLSMALGAFLAGMLISETEYRYQVENDIQPFRDVLLGLFFVTIGMLLDVRMVWANFGWVMATMLSLIIAKTLIVTVLARFFTGDIGNALRTGLYLGQGGEFGFVLLSLGSGVNLLPAALLQTVLAAMLLSMLVAPFLIQHSDKIVRKLCADDWTQRAMEIHQIAAAAMATTHHVILCGYGRSGQALARFLEQEAVSFFALDLDPERVKKAAAAGETVVYGDAAKREVLIAAGLLRAQAVVITYADTASALRILAVVQETRPDLPVLARTIDDADVDKLRAAGAVEVVSEVMESALMLSSHTLMLLGVPLNKVVKKIREARETRYNLFRGFFRGLSDDSLEKADRLQARLHTVMINASAYALDKTLGDLGLERFLVEVKAVRRRNIRGYSPAAETRLQQGDVVVLLGIPEHLRAAESWLLEGGNGRG